jgi:hypothetical protein
MKELLPAVLYVLGVGFLLANVRIFVQFIRFLRLRSSALLTWPGRRPPFYGLLLLLAATLSVLIAFKIGVRKQHPLDVFGESMMLLYYIYALPLSLRIGRGFYEDGVWADSGFIPYSHIGGLTWREEGQLTLVLMHRMRSFARPLVVPESHYGAVRRLLRDKIAAHAIQFPEKPLDLGAHDERDDV